VRHWAHFLLLPLAGVDDALPIADRVLGAARGVAIAGAVLGFGYLVNSVADRGMDLDASKRVADGSDPRRLGLLGAALAATALALSVTAPWATRAAVAVSLVSGWAYSTGPRLKRLPVLGSLLNLSSFGPLLFVGLARDALPPALVPLSGVFAGLLLQNQLLHEAADAEEDRRGGLSTTFARFGPACTALAAATCGGAVALVVGLRGDSRSLVTAAVLAGVFGAVFPAWLASSARRPAAMRVARLLHRVASLCVGAWLYVGWSLLT
jgi:4-hydroxybenzoate polyprenyltransferase